MYISSNWVFYETGRDSRDGYKFLGGNWGDHHLPDEPSMAAFDFVLAWDLWPLALAAFSRAWHAH